MTKKEDARLAGRHPEFSRQSRRPGVGAPAVADLALEIEKWVTPTDLVDVPMAVLHGKSPLPLGRFMRNKLRLSLGLPEGAPDEVLRQAWAEQVLPVLKMAKASSASPSLRSAFRAQNQAYADSLALKMSIHEKGKL